MNNTAKLHLHPFIIGTLLVLAAFVLPAVHTIDIHLHDTYFVIVKTHFLIVAGALLFAIGILVRITRSLVRHTWLYRFHIIASCVCLLLLGILPQLGAVDRYVDFSAWPSNSPQSGAVWLSRGYLACLLVFILVQIVFVYNLVAGIVSKLRKN